MYNQEVTQTEVDHVYCFLHTCVLDGMCLLLCPTLDTSNEEDHQL